MLRSVFSIWWLRTSSCNRRWRSYAPRFSRGSRSLEQDARLASDAFRPRVARRSADTPAPAVASPGCRAPRARANLDSVFLTQLPARATALLAENLRTAKSHQVFATLKVSRAI